MPQTNTYHIPALLPQCLDALDIRPDGTYVDVTLGGGGHTRAILDRLSPGGHLYSMDQDIDAIERVPQGDPRLTVIHGNFRFLSNFMRYYGISTIDGLLGDLGVSFHHFDDPGRGFSFRWDGPLDMRMNRSAALTAARLLNEATEQEISDILYLYGELRQSRRIAAAIVSRRHQTPVETIEQLLGIVSPFIDPRKEKKELAQLFQALRIRVNNEIQALEQLLIQAAAILRPGGRLAIITYHSLEDRLVKNFMKTGRLDGHQEKDFYGRTLSPLRLLTSKPIVPDDHEIQQNPRSRSAKLRVAVKL